MRHRRHCRRGVFLRRGLRTAAWLHVIQISVKMLGFAIAVPWALHAIGGWPAFHAMPAAYTSPVGVGWSGVLGYIVLFAPNFFISPGLLQKMYGARDESAVRKGIGWHALVLIAYAALPAILGMIARTLHPGIAPELALPVVLRELLPTWLGALLLGAVVSAEMSAGDAVLFMLSTSLAKDIYKGLVNPNATEAQFLRVTRITSVVAGLLGTGFAILIPTVEAAVKGFYGLLTVVLLVPLVAGLYVKSPTKWMALASMVVSLVVGVKFGVPAGIASGAVVMGAMTCFDWITKRRSS